MWKKIYRSYQKEIYFLQKKGNELLQEINQHETKMNKKKQQKLQPDERDLYQLDKMIKSMLKLMAVIESYRYLQLLKMPLTNENMLLFYSKTNYCYNDLLQRSMLKLNQLRYKKIIEIEESIDFTIN